METPNNPSDTPDVNKDNTGNDTKKTFEVSKEDFEKLQELEKNKSTALKQERDEKKALIEKLALYEAKEKEAEEKDKLKKGKYEEVIAEKDELIKSLTEKANNWDLYSTQKLEQIQKELTDLSQSIGEDVLKEHEEILNELSDEKKIIYLKKLEALKQKPTFDGEPGSGEKDKGTEKDVKLEELKKKGSLGFMAEMFKQS